MSVTEALKEIAGATVEVIKENPVAAAAIAGTAVVAGGGFLFWRRRKAKKANGAPVKEVLAAVEATAAAGNELIANAHQQLTAAASEAMQ